MSEAMMWLLVRGVWETLAMTFVSGFFGFVIGLPVGVLLYVTRPGQIMENAGCIAPSLRWSIFSARFPLSSCWCG